MKNSKLPGKVTVVEDENGRRYFEMDIELFMALYRHTGCKSKKYRIMKKKVKQVFNQALLTTCRNMINEFTNGN